MEMLLIGVSLLHSSIEIDAHASSICSSADSRS